MRGRRVAGRLLVHADGGMPTGLLVPALSARQARTSRGASVDAEGIVNLERDAVMPIDPGSGSLLALRDPPQQEAVSQRRAPGSRLSPTRLASPRVGASRNVRLKGQADIDLSRKARLGCKVRTFSRHVMASAFLPQSAAPLGLRPPLAWGGKRSFRRACVKYFAAGVLRTSRE